MRDPGLRSYSMSDAVVFWRTTDAFGALSNMAAGYPLLVGDVHARTVEALYQACRFPNDPVLQTRILGQASPITAKRISREHIDRSRPDWLRVRVAIMRWCLRVKLASSPERFAGVLLSTGRRPIVERSSRDRFWGAVPVGDRLDGANVLGRLLMELRRDLPAALASDEVEPPEVPNLLLCGHAVPAVALSRDGLGATSPTQPALPRIDPRAPP